MRFKLRPYQIDAIYKLRESFKKGNKRVVLVSPTGSGKTVIASAIVELATMKNSGKVLFIAHRREIIDQTSKKLDEVGIHHGVMMGDDGRYDPSAPVQVASIQTLIRRDPPPADIIIIDECHLSLAKSYIDTIKKYEDSFVLGLTATPWRTDGKGMGILYEDMVVVSQVQDLVRKGFLVNPEFYAPARPDLSTARIKYGDYVAKDLARIMNKSHLVGDITDHWKKLAYGLCTVVFASSRDHSKSIVRHFTADGISAEHIDHKTPKHERNAVLDRLKSGETKVVSNVGLLTEGWDLPELQCIVIARPTMSETLYLQMVGRVMRPLEWKKRALIVDHAGCFFQHNSPIANRNYSLANRKISRNKKVSTRNIKICRRCKRICHRKDDKCRNCGRIFSGRRPITVSGKLSAQHAPEHNCIRCKSKSLVKAKCGYNSKNVVEFRCANCKLPNFITTPRAKNLTQKERHKEFFSLCHYAKSKNYKKAWANCVYKTAFKTRPAQDGL